MIDYKKLYFILFNAITDALGCPDFDQAKSLLIDAQLSAEDEYMSFDEEEAAKGAFEESERLRDVLSTIPLPVRKSGSTWNESTRS